MLVLLDNGHGGLIAGKYQTSGKRSPVWYGNSQLFEGEFNRAIVNGIAESLALKQVPYVVITPEHTDISLSERVTRANAYKNQPCFFVSVHSNAGGGNGCEFFTSPGQTKSDQIATIFGEEFKKRFPNSRLRSDFSDGDSDKESNFYVLTNTAMPAILTENFFMDSVDECLGILMTVPGRRKIINFHVDAIIRVRNELA